MKTESRYTEEKLIEGCVKCDRTAQKALYDTYAPILYPVCIRYVGREIGKDVLQDGFVTIFEKIGTYKGEGSFEGWMRRIIINTALMQIRKNDVMKHSEDISEVQVAELGVQNSGVMEEITSREILDLISEMPAGLRSVFNLFVLEGYSHQEVAEILGINEASSRSQVSRARIWLQERMKKLYNDR